MAELCFNGMLGSIEETVAKVQDGSLSFIEGIDFLCQSERHYHTKKAMQGRVSRSKNRCGQPVGMKWLKVRSFGWDGTLQRNFTYTFFYTFLYTEMWITFV